MQVSHFNISLEIRVWSDARFMPRTLRHEYPGAVYHSWRAAMEGRRSSRATTTVRRSCTGSVAGLREPRLAYSNGQTEHTYPSGYGDWPGFGGD